MNERKREKLDFWWIEAARFARMAYYLYDVLLILVIEGADSSVWCAFCHCLIWLRVWINKSMRFDVVLESDCDLIERRKKTSCALSYYWPRKETIGRWCPECWNKSQLIKASSVSTAKEAKEQFLMRKQWFKRLD